MTSSQQRRSIGLCVYSWFVFNNDQQFLLRMICPAGQGSPHLSETTLFHPRMICPAGQGPHLSETTPSSRWRETGSKSSVSRLFINIDAQDAQDYLARGYTFLSSTIAYASIGISKTRSHAHGSLRTRTRSSSQSASPAAAFRPVYPVYPIYRCSQIQPTGLTGHWSLFATGPEGSLFHPRMIRTAGRGGRLTRIGAPTMERVRTAGWAWLIRGASGR